MSARAALTAALLLAGCATRQPVLPVRQTPGLPVSNALSAGVQRAAMPPLDGAEAALGAFRQGCPALLKRIDASGLTQPGDWAEPCSAAADTTDARRFFTRYFVAVRVADGRGLNTGYYEPELAASRTRAPGYRVPLYRRPPDPVEADLGQFDLALEGKRIRGRVDDRRLVPYPDRGAIDDGALAGRGLELAWAADAYAAFFLEIQGSGRLRLPDGSVLRVGYDGQNGLPYTAIGKRLRDRNALAPGQATMAGIIGWMRAHPAEARDLLRENRSKVFFRALTLPPDAGPPGALGVPLTAEVSVAADPRFVPLGGPLWLESTVGGAALRRMMVAQDTGGAIKGANRLDLFRGSGDAAGAVAGGITATGSTTLLIPLAAARRVTG